MILNENPNTRLKSSLLGFNDKVLTFAIGTSMNPMGNRLSSRENEELLKSFKRYLADSGYQYIQIQGKYRDIEKSFVIFNISIEMAKKLFLKYNQESFIFCQKKKPGEVTYEYWEKPENGNYSKKESATKINNQSQADDYYSRLHDYKFNIDFNFEDENKVFDKLEKLTEEDMKFLEKFTNDKLAGFGTYMHNRIIYSSKK